MKTTLLLALFSCATTQAAPAAPISLAIPPAVEVVGMAQPLPVVAQPLKTPAPVITRRLVPHSVASR
jgi:hypothetical protein